MIKINRQDRDRFVTALEAAARCPTDEELASAPLLEGWMAVMQIHRPVLIGTPEGHPTLGNEDHISTSPVMRFDPEAGYARTQSRWYRLGKPMKETDPEAAVKIMQAESLFCRPVKPSVFEEAIALEVRGLANHVSQATLDA